MKQSTPAHSSSTPANFLKLIAHPRDAHQIKTSATHGKFDSIQSQLFSPECLAKYFPPLNRQNRSRRSVKRTDKIKSISPTSSHQLQLSFPARKRNLPQRRTIADGKSGVTLINRRRRL